MTRPLRIVGIGGGTGLPLVLRGLTRLAEVDRAPAVCLTAIVSVSDDGGSSGRLRRAFRVPALGDLRNCLLGLARGDSPWAQLLAHRFASGRGLAARPSSASWARMADSSCRSSGPGSMPISSISALRAL